MGTKERAPLTEGMFYILMALLHGDMCGTEITAFVSQRTQGRVSLGPGTLYTLLGKFLEQRLIEEVAVSGRRRTYRITQPGIDAYHEELHRMYACLQDARAEKHSPAVTNDDPLLCPAY